MQHIKHILCVVDPTATLQHCVEKGAVLARKFGATLELFVCDYQSGLIPAARLSGELVQRILTERRVQIERQLRGLVEPLRQAGLHVLADFSFQEHLHTGVIRKVRLSGADIVVKDTHYHGAIQRALFTNSDWHLIRECPVPLLLTKPSPWRTSVRIAAAVDPGHIDDKPAELDRRLLQVASGFASALGGEALAVHAFDAVPLLSGMVSGATGIGIAPEIDLELLDSMRKWHDVEFKALLAGPPVFAGRASTLEGSPSFELPAFAAREGVDVLVTGAVSRSPLRRFLVGSTAEQLLDRLPCDILVVKPSLPVEAFQPVAQPGN